MRKVGGGGGGGCCPLQALYEKRGGEGGGGFTLQARYPPPCIRHWRGFLFVNTMSLVMACYTLTKELYTSNSISNYICVMQWHMQDLGGWVSTRDPHTFSKGVWGSTISSPIGIWGGRFATFAIFKSHICVVIDVIYRSIEVCIYSTCTYCYLT